MNLLHNTESIIAGCSVLSSINKEKINDIDIYVHKEGASGIVDFFDKHLKSSRRSSSYNICPAYDDSFLRANNIKIRLHLNYVDIRGSEKINLDIMVVDDLVDLRNVVRNFDLSFCQVYFDGKKFEAFHPLHVITKSGFLEDSYIQSLQKLNKFTINRIEKYKNINKIPIFGLCICLRRYSVRMKEMTYTLKNRERNQTENTFNGKVIRHTRINFYKITYKNRRFKCPKV